MFKIDYWVDLKGNGEACSNVKKLGVCNADDSTMNFNEMPFIGENGTCAKYRWATRCKVTWDGITSGVTNPCTTPDTA